MLAYQMMSSWTVDLVLYKASECAVRCPVDQGESMGINGLPAMEMIKASKGYDLIVMVPSAAPC